MKSKANASERMICLDIPTEIDGNRWYKYPEAQASATLDWQVFIYYAGCRYGACIADKWLLLGTTIRPPV